MQARKDINCSQDEVPHNAALFLIAFVSKSLSNVETCSNTEREVPGTLHCLEIFLHYCLAHNLRMITDHKPVVTTYRKDVVTLSQQLQSVLLCMQQYRIHI